VLRIEINFLLSKTSSIGLQWDFHIWVLASLYQWERLVEDWIYGSRWARRVSSGNWVLRKRYWAWNFFHQVHE
jgi:hypothetical protein